MPAHLILRNVVLLRFGTGLLVQSKQVYSVVDPAGCFRVRIKEQQSSFSEAGTQLQPPFAFRSSESKSILVQ